MKSNNNPMHLLNSPRCGAKTRSGTPCQSPTMKGKQRCRMHGGNSPGAPKGNKNALKNGFYTATAMAVRNEVRKLIREMRRLVALVG